jgi:hypothetical protein
MGRPLGSPGMWNALISNARWRDELVSENSGPGKNAPCL